MVHKLLVRPCSDIHLEFGGFDLPALPSDHETVLVIPGDLGVVESKSCMADYTIPFLTSCSKRFRAVIMVVGNHEHYNGSLFRTVSKMKDAIKAADLTNVHVLENETHLLDDVVFIGATLWTNCDNFSPYADVYWHSMTDSRRIRTGPSMMLPYQRKLAVRDTWRKWVESKEYILKEIDENKKAGRKVVVVTHHAPSNMSVHPTFLGDKLNMFYYSDMTLNIMDTNPDLWLHGHMHMAFDYYVDSTMQICQTRVVCNPRGYVGMDSDHGFDPLKLIEV